MKYNFNDFPSEDTFMEQISRVFEDNGLECFNKEEILRKLSRFGRYLCSENEKYNLTAISDPYGIAVLHFADSLLFSDAFDKDARVIDIGCGAGFPSIPLAIARPDLHITCLDSTAKKIAFIEGFTSIEGLTNVKTCVLRAEEAFEGQNKAEFYEKYDVATSRAVSGLGIIAELSTGFIKPAGKLISLKGDNVSDELNAKAKILSELGLSEPSISEKGLNGTEKYKRSAVIFKKSGHAQAKYPRKYNIIKNKPLF